LSGLYVFNFLRWLVFFSFLFKLIITTAAKERNYSVYLRTGAIIKLATLYHQQMPQVCKWHSGIKCDFCFCIILLYFSLSLLAFNYVNLWQWIKTQWRSIATYMCLFLISMETYSFYTKHYYCPHMIVALVPALNIP